MPKVIYTLPDGEKHTVDVPLGDTLMRGAVDNGVPGIIGECGGQLSCATCHLYVPEDLAGTFDGPDADETDMLDLVADLEPNSRLGCQLTVTEQHDGLQVHVPSE